MVLIFSFEGYHLQIFCTIDRSPLMMCLIVYTCVCVCAHYVNVHVWTCVYECKYTNNWAWNVNLIKYYILRLDDFWTLAAFSLSF